MTPSDNKNAHPTKKGPGRKHGAVPHGRKDGKGRGISRSMRIIRARAA